MDAPGDALAAINDNGYCIIRNLYPVDLLATLLENITSQKLATGDGKGIPRLNAGSDIIYSPFVENKQFFDLFRQPAVDSILRACLNDPYYKGLDGRPNYTLRSMICRSSKDALPWHIDSFFPYEGPNIISMQVIIPLEPFTASNGPTLLIPASHRSGIYAPQSYPTTTEIIEINVEPGDVILWDARIWHAARENASGRSRWSVIATFTRWWIKQNYQYLQLIREAAQINAFSDDDLIILGGASAVPYSHRERVDVKGGLEQIAAVRSQLAG
ncbi:MAG: phytanoyl-CoA dioxygenase family protein [Herminiimonas sp.]|nr:phytanoyl-CoA dioxygenase family protein [Herminiimonas sp.]